MDAVFSTCYSMGVTSRCCVQHRILKGGYKWMLWADDDTMWFTAGARRLLRRWDHTAVHAITGAPEILPAVTGL